MQVRYSNSDEIAEMNAAEWQVKMLARNYSYLGWGNHEDYMYSSSEKSGWAGAMTLATVSEMFRLDDLNELAHAYFFLERASETCTSCGGSGYNAATEALNSSFYGYGSTGWGFYLKEPEVLALLKSGRLSDLLDAPYMYKEETGTWSVLRKIGDGKREWVESDEPAPPSPDAVNSHFRSKRALGHDAINRWVCVEARAKAQGVWGKCDTCKGQGYVYTEDSCHLGLQMWMLHPRKGASRGVIVEHINQDEIPTVIEYLKTAQTRFNEKFDALTKELS